MTEPEFSPIIQGWGGPRLPSPVPREGGGYKPEATLTGGWSGPELPIPTIQEGGCPDEIASEYAFNMARRASIDSNVRNYRLMYNVNKDAYMKLKSD